MMGANIGLQTLGGVLQAHGQAQGYQQAGQGAAAARAASTAADQTDAALRDELETSRGNIATLRAAAGIDSSSPTSLALIAENREESDRQRRIKVGNLRAQASSSGPC